MSAAVAEAVNAEALTQAPRGLPGNVVPHPAAHAAIGGVPVPHDVFEEAKAGAIRLMQMPPEELRSLIARRVKMLQTELSEREARRAAIEEAMVAQRVLDARRQRARRLRRRVNIGSSLAAAMFTGLVVVSMF
jgi:hypothetical protein